MFAVLTHEDVPDVLYGGMVQDRYLFAKDIVRWEGDVVAGVAALTEEIAEQAAALIEVEYEPLPAVTDIEAAMARVPTLMHERWETDGGRKPRPRRQHARLLDHRQGRRRRRDGDRRRRRARPLRHRPVQGAPIEPRAICAVAAATA